MMTSLKNLLFAFKYYLLPFSQREKAWGLGLLLLFPLSIFAEDLSPIIQKMMESNVTLKKYRAQTDATKAGNHTGMTLTDPEVEFNYLWGSPKDVGQRKDISVTQHFDYATVFGLKRKEARSKDELAEIQYEQARMLCQQEAITALANIAAANETLLEHRSRIATAEQIANMLRKKMNAGEANKLELNKAVLDLATHKTDAAETEMERDEILSNVIFMALDSETKNRLLSITMDDIKEYLTAMNTPTLMQLEQEKAQKEENVAEAELRSARSASLPELTAGYMSELTREEKFRGVTIGLSIPLWSNRGNVTRAKSQIAALKAEREETIASITAQRNALNSRIGQLSRMIESLESSLKVSSSESLMRKALIEGEISMMEYIIDRETYYELQSRLIEAKREQLTKIAELKMLSPAI